MFEPTQVGWTSAGRSASGREASIDAEASLATLPSFVEPLIWSEQQKLTASDTADGDFLGNAVAVDGETAVVGDNVSMLHSVTLGGTGKEEQDRHPKIGNGVLIGAGAKVIGFDIAFSKETAEDEAFAAAMRASGNVVFGMVFNDAGDPSPPSEASNVRTPALYAAQALAMPVPRCSAAVCM